MIVNLEQLIKAMANAQTIGIDRAQRPDFEGFRLAIATREVTTRFAQAYRRSFYEGEIVIAEQTTALRVTAWSMANRCKIVLPARDIVWITDDNLQAAEALGAALARLAAEQTMLEPLDARD